MPAVIGTHQHLGERGRFDCRWMIAPGLAPRRDVPADLAPCPNRPGSWAVWADRGRSG